MIWLFKAAAAGSALLNLGLIVEASKLTPPVLPLVVRNPYLSTWLRDARDPPWTEWPMFWTGEFVRHPCDRTPKRPILSGPVNGIWG